MRQVGFLLVIGVIATTSVTTAKIWRVPSVCPTIQAGIDSAAAVDTVLVADGTYTGDGNRDIDFKGKAILVTSKNGPENCIIDCEGSEDDPHRGFYFHSREDSNSVLQGFTIMNGGYDWETNGAGIYCWSSSPTIRGNIIKKNRTIDCGGGICCSDSSFPIIEINTITENYGAHGGGVCCSFYSSPIISKNTITWNDALRGGGIYCTGYSSPTIEGNAITWNSTPAVGGGIDCYESSPIIVGNIIMKNQAGQYCDGGGGIACRGSSSSTPWIEGNIIAENEAWGGCDVYGGGIWVCDRASPTIVGNTITGNGALEGGGIYCFDANATILSNTITGNTAYTGGGIYCYGPSSATIVGNTLTGNTAYYYGGGIRCLNASPVIDGNTIIGNASDYGGGIYCYGSSPTIVGNTFTENLAGDLGGGIYCWNSSPVVSNSILWGDNAGSGEEIFVVEGDPIIVSFSNVQGGYPGENNIDADPLFVLPEHRDCRLLWGSPCIDSGHPDSLDPDGTRSDMGAYPFDQSHPLTIYLTPDTTLIVRPGELGVTYTLINIEPDPWTFWLRSDVILPNGKPYPGNPIIGPKKVTLPGNKNVQRHITHPVPGAAPLGIYTYKSRIGLPPDQLIDEDSFEFEVVDGL